MTSQLAAQSDDVTTWTEDEVWMDRAIALAEQASGRVAPNPAVGAVIVRDGAVVGEGHTEPPGQRHAEIVALDQAGDLARGATMYVTLEPCAHLGRTPPCLDAVLKAGVRRVVIAQQDPNPLVNGRSIATFRSRGVDLALGVRAERARQLNAGFIKRMTTGMPDVHVKLAMSLDGKIATRTGKSQWITGPEARYAGHVIRDRSDAILVGIGTVLADNPTLTTRIDPDDAGAGGPHHPIRIVVDTHARTPLDATLLQPETPGTTVIVVGEDAPTERVSRLVDTGVTVLSFPVRDEKVDLQAMLLGLGERGINTVMVEGGAEIIGSLADDGLIDRVSVFIAPVILGGSGAPSPVAGIGVDAPDAAIRLCDVRAEPIGNDIRITGVVDHTDTRTDGAKGRCSCSPES